MQEIDVKKRVLRDEDDGNIIWKWYASLSKRKKKEVQNSLYKKGITLYKLYRYSEKDFDIKTLSYNTILDFCEAFGKKLIAEGSNIVFVDVMIDS